MLDKLCQQVCELSLEVGNFIAAQKVESSEIESKSLNNFVSWVDQEAEKKFVAALREILPSAGFIVEEGSEKRTNTRLEWVVDPLDGTTNFLHGIPFYCTSVALLENEQPVLGVIFNPISGNLFSAFKDGGARLNGDSIHCSKHGKLSDSLLATGFPYDDFGRQESYMELLARICQETRGVRRLGSAALDLAYVAWGRFEAFYEYALNPWDVAAGICIVNEAGGRCTGFDGVSNAVFAPDILASNDRVHEEMLKTIALHF